MPFNAPRHSRLRATWDVFCSVVDNHGDAGVCWRLAADLASRGIAVRLWIDDARALAWMARRMAATMASISAGVSAPSSPTSLAASSIIGMA
jgi:hypothetical protein